MNDKQRNEMDESKLALQTVRVLESDDCNDQHDAATHELGRLLRQSADHNLPESNQDLREQLLNTLATGDEPAVSLKGPLEETSPQTSAPTRKRLWAGLAAGALIAAGGWLLYQPQLDFDLMGGQKMIGQLDLSMVSSTPEPSTPEPSTAKPSKLELSTAGSSFQAPLEGQRLLADTSESTVEFEKQIAEVEPVAKRVGSDGPADKVRGMVTEDLDFRKLRGFGTPAPQVPDPNTALAQKSKPSPGNIGFRTDTGKLGMRVESYRRLGEENHGSAQNKLERDRKKNQQGQFASRQGGKVASSNRAQQNGSGTRTAGSESKDYWRLSETSPTSRATGGSVPSGDALGGGGGIKRSSDPFHNGKNELAANPRFRENQGGELFDYNYDNGMRGGDGEGRSSGEQYKAIYENAFVKAHGGAAISTFSIDVDTASYANLRRFLNSGQTPPRDSIRIEELVNYFQYDYPQPKGDDPFSVNMELASCPWDRSHKLLRVGLKGKDIHVQERPPTNVVFLMDVSGSMNSADKLPLLKRGFQMMVKQLGENDRVSIVTYAGNAGVALEPTTGDNTKTINEAIERLTPGGSTHGSAGIELAYKLAQQHFITGGVNKVILATDGDLNVGVTADGALVDLIQQKASEGVFLTVLGFGTGNLKDGKLEQLADNGNGHYAYIDSNREAHRVLVQQLSGSLVTIAKDVKIQIEFNPAEVKSYRLVGYENRMLATEDFADDLKDAGEIGAGHTVTAIYEIEPTGNVAAAMVAPQGMKYQVSNANDANTASPNNDVQKANLSDAAESGELATLALRYKQPDENRSKRIEFTIKNEEKSFTSASDDFRFAASVAGFGMLLRDSAHAGTASPQMILEMASQSMGKDTTGYRAEFVDLVRKAFAR